MPSGDKHLVPEGFAFATARAGIKSPDRDDMGLIYCREPSWATGVFTKNRLKAAPVVDGQRKLRRPRRIKAILVNSGCANACTGKAGMRDLKRLTTELAKSLGVSEGSVLMSSTGVIGQRLPLQKMLPALSGLVEATGHATAEDFARAIMTTDRFPKIAFREVTLSGKKGRVLGIAKGAGMIAPDMATMLAYVLTDVAVEVPLMKKLLLETVEETFNTITVDNDMSTNDTVILLSSSMAGNHPLGMGSRGLKGFRSALYDVMDDLARMIVSDGEGATRTVEVIVKGALSDTEARRASKAVAGSLLVKTALYGADPNWGRIMAALGASGIRFREDKVEIRLNGIKVVSSGVGTGRENEARQLLKDSRAVNIEIRLKQGRATARALGSDLTEEYVRLNAHYTT